MKIPNFLRKNFRISLVLFSFLALLLFGILEIQKMEFNFGNGVAVNLWAGIHILFMSLAFAVFTVSFLVGLVYLIQQFQIKNHRPGRFLDWLPSLEAMDGIHYKALTVGFLLLSGGILAGMVLSKTTEGRFFSGDSRQRVALVTWGLYAFFLNLRLKSAWRGRRGIFLSLLGFLGVILAFIGLEHRF